MIHLVLFTKKIYFSLSGGFAIWLAVHPAFAQFRFESNFTVSTSVDVDEVNRSALQQLKQAEDYLAISRWESAIDLYQRVMEEYGSELIFYDQQGKPYPRYRTVREHCHCQIVSWSERYPRALDTYRRRVDPEAKFLYEQGVQYRDEERLKQVVQQFFASSVGDDSLSALAELSLERGEYTKARGYWRRVSPLLYALTSNRVTTASSGPGFSQHDLVALSDRLEASQKSNACLVYPDTDLPPASLFARLVLVSVMERSRSRARVELDLLSQRWSAELGTWAGQRVVLQKVLEAWYEESATWPDLPRDKGWGTFAGNAARNGTVEKDLDIVPRVVWTRLIGPPSLVNRMVFSQEGGSVRRWGRDVRSYFPYFPVAIGNLILVCDEDFVWGFDVNTGRAAFPSGSQEVQDRTYGRLNKIAYISRPDVDLSSRHWSLPGFSLTVFGDKLFGRLGGAMSMVHDKRGIIDGPDDVSYAVSLDLSKQGKLAGELVQSEEPGLQLEGAPLADAGSIYLVGRHEDGMRTRSYVSAYDWETGQMRWNRFIVSSERAGQGVVQDVADRLLTMQQGHLFFNTNQGVVCALDGRQGDVLWMTRYPRIDKGSYEDPDFHLLRGVNPCLVYKEKVIVAPSDCRQIFALDSMTGELNWESTVPQDVQHVLGVRGDKLLVSGDSLWWLDVNTGRVLSRFPPLGSADLTRSGSSPRGAGRGLITSDTVWWPTREGVLLFDLHTQRHVDTIWFTPALAAAGVSGGNLLMSQGHLIVATADRLIAFNESGIPTWSPTTMLNPSKN